MQQATNLESELGATMKIWRDISTLFQRNEIRDVPQADTTCYQVETYTGNYRGTIAYQDDIIVKLQTLQAKKPVKIMKENIVRIRIVNTDATNE